MSLLSNNLLNNMVTIKTAAIEHSSLFKPGVLDAIVMASSPLLDNGKAVKDQFQITLQDQTPAKNVQTSNNNLKQQTIKQAILEIISKQAFPKGSKIQLNINTDNSAKIISVIDPHGKLILGKPIVTNSSNLTPNLTNTFTSTSIKQAVSHQPVNTNRQAVAKPLTQAIASKPVTSPEVTIANAMRQALPLQQPLKLLAPLLQQLSNPTNSELPKSITQLIKVLLATIPSAEQAQNPKTLKRALLNSGPFLEGKLNHITADHQKRQIQQAKLSSNQLSQLPTKEHLKDRDTSIINADSKAASQKLIQQIEQILGKPLTASKKTNSKTALDDNQTKLPIDPALLKNLNQVHVSQKASTSNNKENLDVILQQLGRQLLASLAKTQLNQLETLRQRNKNTNEPAGTNSWTLEIPIMNGKQADNMELHIQEESDSDDKPNKQKKWRVMLNFDLHKLGKMSVELVVINTSVSAIIWSELKYAHQQVQNEIDSFKKGLEKIGVNVNKIECRIGIPEKRDKNLSPLVDVRT